MKVKKLLSFILVAAMMLSVFVLPATAVSENEIVVHYYNENNWESPYIYYYNDGNTPVSWPGTAMNNDGDNWYSYTISGYSSAKVIFSNNGADQYPAQNQEGLTVSGEKWYKLGSFYDQNPDLSKVSVHYYNSNQWGSPYIYYYTDSETPVTWPGTAMTSDGNGWYSYDIYGFDEVKVIFSDNGANQIPQQNETGYTVTGEKWFINGTLYDAEPDGITVHFYDYNNWGNVNIYYYNGNHEGTSWTGVPMYADGDGWYTYKIYGYDEARVLFNNGRGTQIPDVMVEGFPVSDEMWYRNGTWTTERPDEITVYFYKPDGWSAPNIYYYLNDSDTGPAWPGSAMTEVSDGWYAYTITKYASAKVMFNDGTNQIPAQNQPGLDATGIMWYKNGVWCNSESDTDSDELLDYMELVLGTNINNADTDGDGLPDGYEVMTLGTDPLKADSDSNGVNDGAEDADSDALNNLREYQLGTDPNKADTDDDGLTDCEEVNTYNTNPLEEDTDGDSLSDGDDVALGFSPLLQDTDGNGVLDCNEKVQQSFTQEIECEDKPQVSDVSVSFNGTGNINSTTTITSIYNIDMLSTNLVGLVGAPVEIETESSFEEAVITFKVDKSKLGNVGFKNLGILWYDEENDLFKMQETTLDEANSTVSATVTHFSKYMVVDKASWFDAWQQEIVYNLGTENIRTVLAIDCSGSMSWNDPEFYYTDGNSVHTMMTYRKMAADHFISSMKDGSKASIVTFDSSANVVVPMTNDIITLKSGLSYIYSSGGTSFNSAIQTSLPLFENDISDYSNKIIMLLTDGEDSVSDSVLQSASNEGIKIYTVGIGDDIDTNVLEYIANYTGGEFYIAKTAEDIVDIYSNMMMLLGADMSTDTDNDGLPDIFETAGMRLSTGEIIYTNPFNADTDGDGLNDGEEIIPQFKFVDSSGIGLPGFSCGIYFSMLSDPTMRDTDGDGDKDNDDPNSLYYQLNGNLIQKIDDLFRLASLFNSENQLYSYDYTTDIEYWLVFMFIRQFNSNYIGDNWDGTGGVINQDFVDYVEKQNYNLYNYFSVTKKFFANNDKEEGDLYHLAATMTGLIYKSNWSNGWEFGLMPEAYINNLSGWAGDLQTAMNDAMFLTNNSNDYLTFYNTMKNLIGYNANNSEIIYPDDKHSFDLEDLYSDTDAYNILKYYIYNDITIKDALLEYYSTGIYSRFHKFTNYWGRDTIDSVTSQFTQTKFLGIIRWPLFDYDFNQTQSNAAKDAFVDFLMERLYEE